MKSRIVVIGGGFAGLYAALAAARVGEGHVAVSLVSREAWLTIRPRLYEADPASLRADLIAPLETVGATFLPGEVTGLNGQEFSLASGKTIPFDRAIVATGSVMPRPLFPGAALCHSIDDGPSAESFDDALRDSASAPLVRITVIGAGFTGIELALELRDRIARQAGEAAAERARIVLLDAATDVGAELGPGPRPAIQQALAEARIETRVGIRIAAVHHDSVELVGGGRIPSDVAVLCTGLRAAPFVANLAGLKDSHGRLVVDRYLRAPEVPSVFVAGDAAAAETEPGRPTLMSCQHALTLGRFAGENAARDLLGLPLIPYAQSRYVTCLDLGRSGAVFSEGWDRKPKLTGAEAKRIKVEINTRRIYPPTGDRDAILAASRLP